jgi:prepilin-type N-terminal cleavage/methylation domain-containing protein
MERVGSREVIMAAMHRRGFTLVELVAVVGVAAVGAGVMLAVQPKEEEVKKKDQTQLRGLIQAMVIWAQNNKDNYPLPSLLDLNDATVSQRGAAKDTTANIMSLMVYNGMIATELLVSPAEKNEGVNVKEDYEFDQPKTTVKPAEALWDPKLKAGLGKEGGNISYANLQPCGDRKKKWSNTFITTEMPISTRGPEIRKATKNHDGTVTPVFVKEDSVTLRFYGDGKSWSGFHAFNDGHVDFAADEMASGRVMGKHAVTYLAGDQKPWPDLWSFDEPDDTAGANHYLGIFTKAGEKREDWRAEWD